MLKKNKLLSQKHLLLAGMVLSSVLVHQGVQADENEAGIPTGESPSLQVDRKPVSGNVPSEKTYQAPVASESSEGTGETDNSKLEEIAAAPTPVKASVIYEAQVAGDKTIAARDGQLSGTTGQSKQLESISVKVDSTLSGGVSYRTHVQTNGWLQEVSNGAVSGKPQEHKRVEAISMQLTGELAKAYDIYYRTHIQDLGWIGWAKNGASAGTAGFAKQMEGYQVRLVKKGEEFATGGPAYYSSEAPTISYQVHVQNIGWQDFKKNGQLAGTTGRALRMEGLRVAINGYPANVLGLSYRAYVQNGGWQAAVSSGQLAGSAGKAQRMEALELKLTGSIANQYNIQYRAHVSNVGWMDWVQDGQVAGTTGKGLAMEAVEIRLVKRNQSHTSNTTKPAEPPKPVNPTPLPKESKAGFVDLSSHNGELSEADFRELARQGIRGAVVKLTEHTTYKNPFAASHIKNAKAAGLQVSAYAYSHYQSAEDARKEARFFVQRAKELGLPSNTVMVNDIEENYMRTNINANTQAWADEMRRQGFSNLIYYASASWLDQNNLGIRGPISTSQFGLQNFWVAQYPAKNMTFSQARGMSYNSRTAAWQFGSDAELIKGKHVFDVNIDYTGRFTSNTSAPTSQPSKPVTPTPQPKPTTNTSEFKVGDNVLFNGTYTISSLAYPNVVSKDLAGQTGRDGVFDPTPMVEVDGAGRATSDQILYSGSLVRIPGTYKVLAVDASKSAVKVRIGSRESWVDSRKVTKTTTATTPNTNPVTSASQGNYNVLNRIIYLDAGHGGSDPGAVRGNVREAELALSVHNKLRRRLEQEGFKVISTRTDNSSHDLTERSVNANRSFSDLFVSLHFNASEKQVDSSKEGIETYWYQYFPEYYPSMNAAFHNNPQRLERSQYLATAIQNNLIGQTHAPNRGVKRQTFSVLRETVAPAVLVELGFVSHANEAQKIVQSAYQDKLVAGVLNGIKEYYKHFG